MLHFTNCGISPGTCYGTSNRSPFRFAAIAERAHATFGESGRQKLDLRERRGRRLRLYGGGCCVKNSRRGSGNDESLGSE